MEELPRPFPQARLLGDERLARLVAAGSERAFATLYERYHQAVYRYCRSILRDETDSQDAVQSTFTRALDALQRRRRDAPLSPWLFRIAHNESISVIRRRQTRHELSADLEQRVAVADDRAEERDRLDALLADLQELPERQRAAILMRELSGLSHVEIAIALSTTTAGAKQAIFEARTALAEFAEGRAMPCADVRQVIVRHDRRVLRGRRLSAHLRDCVACAAFATASSPRRQGVRGIVPLPPAALLARVLPSRAEGAIGSSLSAGFGPLVAGKLAGTALLTKAIVGLAVIAGVAAGTQDIVIEDGHRAPQSAPASPPAATAAPLRGGAPRLRHSATKAHAAQPRDRLTRAGKAPAVPDAGNLTPSDRTGGESHPRRSNGASVKAAPAPGVGSTPDRQAQAPSGAGGAGGGATPGSPAGGQQTTPSESVGAAKPVGAAEPPAPTQSKASGGGSPPGQSTDPMPPGQTTARGAPSPPGLSKSGPPDTPPGLALGRSKSHGRG